MLTVDNGQTQRHGPLAAIGARRLRYAVIGIMSALIFLLQFGPAHAGCLDIDMNDRRGENGKGRNVISWSQCHGGRNQRWRHENGMLKADTGGRTWCLDINRSEATGQGSVGRNVIAWPDCHGRSNQVWHRENLSYKAFLAGLAYCLDVDLQTRSGEGGRGRNVIAWPECHGRGNQQWSLD